MLEMPGKQSGERETEMAGELAEVALGHRKRFGKGQPE